MIKLHLFDIEGTTTDINFVHQVLFPYSNEKMEEFVLHHQTHAQVFLALKTVQETVRSEEGREIDLQETITVLKKWIQEDRKHPALKEIQGLIWDRGYAENHFKGHLYPDVLPYFKRIISVGQKIAIYSSGSVHAQKLIFGYSTEGDVTPLISNYFDTKFGHKREKSSYENITRELSLAPQEVQFYSDIAEELQAASEAGLKTVQVFRSGGSSSSYLSVSDFRSLTAQI